MPQSFPSARGGEWGTTLQPVEQKGIDLFYRGGILVSDMTTKRCAPKLQPAHVSTFSIR
jgi:hypothetical protein